MKSLNLAERCWALASRSPGVQWLLLKKQSCSSHMECCSVSRAAFLCFCPRSRCLVLLLNLSFPPCLVTAVANNWRPEPCARPSAERPAAHRVGTAPPFFLKKQKTKNKNISSGTFLCEIEQYPVVRLFAGTRTERCVSGMRRESVCIPCTS